jgi:hypothetical protein
MDEKTMKNLQQFEQMFQHACQVCDPLDYKIRQRNLLYTVCNLMLLPLMEYREEEKKKATEKDSVNPTELPIEQPNAE